MKRTATEKAKGDKKMLKRNNVEVYQAMNDGLTCSQVSIVKRVVDMIVDDIVGGYESDLDECIASNIESALIYSRDRWEMFESFSDNDPSEASFDDAQMFFYDEIVATVNGLFDEIGEEIEEDAESVA